jgi:hypothetical protein
MHARFLLTSLYLKVATRAESESTMDRLPYRCGVQYSASLSWQPRSRRPGEPQIGVTALSTTLATYRNMDAVIFERGADAKNQSLFK